MGKQQTITAIESLLSDWRSDDAKVVGVRAEDVFKQMPITLYELTESVLGECGFEDLVRLAAHDVFDAATV